MVFAALPLLFALLFAVALPASAQHQAVKHAAKKSMCHLLTETELKNDTTLTQSCYTVKQFASVHGAVTVNPGVTIFLLGGASLVMEEGGSLKAIGTPDQPITFRGYEHTPGTWAGLKFNSNSANNQLSMP